MKINVFGDFVVEDVSILSMSDSLKSTIESAEFNVVNFEAPIRTFNATKEPKSGPSLCQDPLAPDWLIKNGFNIFCLANNHIFDYGENGFISTINAFNGSNYVGAGTFKKAFEPVIIESDGIRVAIFSLTELQFGIFYEYDPSKPEIMAAGWINHPTVDILIKEAKSKYDYVILIAHAGLECEDIPLPEWRQRYRQFIDYGCDVVIGGHTHCPQGFEVYHDKLIFYSVGNFCFGKQIDVDENWNLGEVISLDISNEGINYLCMGIKYENGHLSLVDSELWKKKLIIINEKLQSNNYGILVDNMCRRHLKDYYLLCTWSGFVHPYGLDIRILIKLIIYKLFRMWSGFCSLHMLNNLQCETHRWCFMRGLKLLN